MLALSAPPLTGLGEQLHGGAGQGTGLLGLGARPAAPPRGEDGMVRSVALVLGGSSGQCPTSSPEALHGGGAGSTDKKRKGWREAACEFLSSPPKGGSPNGRRVSASHPTTTEHVSRPNRPTVDHSQRTRVKQR